MAFTIQIVPFVVNEQDFNKGFAIIKSTDDENSLSPEISLFY